MLIDWLITSGIQARYLLCTIRILIQIQDLPGGSGAKTQHSQRREQLKREDPTCWNEDPMQLIINTFVFFLLKRNIQIQNKASRISALQELNFYIFAYPSYLIFLLCCVCAKSLQSCLTLCDPIDCSPPGSPIHGNLQAGILEWVTMPSSRGSSQPRDRNCLSYIFCVSRQVLYHQCHLGSPHITSYAPKCPRPS